MAVKKSDLYSALWDGANELRGGMDASSYKDYVLVLIFVKYVTDKYKGKKDALIEVPEGGSFDDMVAAKGKPDIGDRMNKIIKKLAEANDLEGIIDSADFNDEKNLGSGKDMIDTLSGLIEVFCNENLNFGRNVADGDDIIGDVYEYFMKQFASESGKSKGQFYTPSEVSRIMAKIIGVGTDNRNKLTAYDMTCGSGSLLLKVGSEAEGRISLYGQDKDTSVANLAQMNMFLHNNPTAVIKGGKSVLSSPEFKDGEDLKTFDYCVANPPFSQKNWMNGFETTIEKDKYHRFDFGTPPEKNGDYAFLSHMIKSLKSTGKGAIVLPHGVLFRGNAEEEIRTKIIKAGYIKGIIGLPINLFYGTGIPACIIVLDKENAQNRKGIFMIDASKGFRKDGDKNRLREQDIHKIVTTFVKQIEEPKYSRMVTLNEIEKNGYNLNLTRYIDSQDEEDLQSIDCHLSGLMPNYDIDKFQKYWDVFKGLENIFFERVDDNYSRYIGGEKNIEDAVNNNQDFREYTNNVEVVINSRANGVKGILKSIDSQTKPKALISIISESLLIAYKPDPLLDSYDIYQMLMDYWDSKMQDDTYIIIENGWKPEVIACKKEKTTKKNAGKERIETFILSDLLPVKYLIEEYFEDEGNEIRKLISKLEGIVGQKQELIDDNCNEGGNLAGNRKKDGGFSVKADKYIKERINELEEMKDREEDDDNELEILKNYLKLKADEKEVKDTIKAKRMELNGKLFEKFNTLTDSDFQYLIVEKKRLTYIVRNTLSFNNKTIQTLNQGIKALHERYGSTLGEIEGKVNNYESKVKEHLRSMGFSL